MELPKAKTHREATVPRISARSLADFMAATERGKRSIVRDSKYISLARVVQHDEAKTAAAKFVREGKDDISPLADAAQRLRARMADTDFDRDLFDHNADYIDRFAKVQAAIKLPDAARLPPGKVVPIEINGLKVGVEIHFRLRRMTKTNKVRVGAGMLRYAKGKPLSPMIAAWQSAFLFGYLGAIGVEDGAAPEHGLCITLDAYTGTVHGAPTDSARRYLNMAAACETISEWWPNVKPPPGAVL